MLKSLPKVFLIFAAVLSMHGAANECKEECDKIINAFEKEVEMKDLTSKKLETATIILQAQRDKAYDMARQNKSNGWMSLLVGAGAGCALAGEAVEVRLGCGAAALIACVIGGCQ